MSGIDFETPYHEHLPQMMLTVGSVTKTPRDFYYIISTLFHLFSRLTLLGFGTVENERWKFHLKAEEYLTRTFFIDDMLGAELRPWLCTIDYYHEKELLYVLSNLERKSEP